MRLWSLHPVYLDARGLVALWSEGLLAQKVLRGRTRGYRNHPQLDRFKDLERPVAAIATYLEEVANEATRRGYSFDARKIARGRIRKKLSVTSGQLEYEFDHLRRKLWRRDRRAHRELDGVTRPKAHPVFSVKSGAVEDWEAL